MSDRDTVSRRRFLRDGAAAAAALSVAAGLGTGRARAQGADAELGCGVIGVGRHGRNLLSELVKVPNVVVVAYADPYDKARDRAAQIDRDIPSYEDAAAMLKVEKGIDAVIVASSTHTHAAACQEALAAAKHVFCEAPLAHTVEAAQEIAKAAQAAGKVFQVGHQRRCGDLYTHAYKFIQIGLVGDLKQARAQWNSHETWRRAVADQSREKLLNWRLYKESSGGLVGEYGSHAFDLVHWYAKAAPEAVVGIGGIDIHADGREVPDNIHVAVEYSGGMKAAFSATLASSHGGQAEVVAGTKGTMWLSREKSGLLFKEADATRMGWEELAHKGTLGDEEGIVLDAHATRLVKPEEEEQVKAEDAKTVWRREMDAFFACIREQKEPPCTALDGLKAVVVAAKANEAIETGTKVTIPPELLTI